MLYPLVKSHLCLVLITLITSLFSINNNAVVNVGDPFIKKIDEFFTFHEAGKSVVMSHSMKPVQFGL